MSIWHVFFWFFCVIIEEVILGVEMHDLFGFCTPLKGKRLDCMIKLIATDMDGTFLTDDKTYDKPLFERLFDRFLFLLTSLDIALGS